MGFSFSTKKWQDNRPEAAEGTGVAKAITALEKASAVSLGSMTSDQAATAQDAANKLAWAFKGARDLVKKDGKNKDRTKFLDLIKTWIDECETYEGQAKQRIYDSALEIFQKAYDNAYVDKREMLVSQHKRAHEAFLLFESKGKVPTATDIQRYQRSAELIVPLLSAAGIDEIRPDKLKVAVRASDIALGKDVSQIKKLVAELHGWCEEFAKGAKREARGMMPGLDESKEVEKALKALMMEYDKAIRTAKPLIASAKEAAAGATKIADAIESEIAARTTGGPDGKVLQDPAEEKARKREEGDVFRKFFGMITTTAAEVKRLKEEHDAILKLHTNGPLSRLADDMEDLAGFTSDHRKKYKQMADVLSTACNRISLPLANAAVELRRGQQAMKNSSISAGYAV